MPKGSSGINRVGSGVSVTGKAPTKNDKVFRFVQESEEDRQRRTKHSTHWTSGLPINKNDEAIRAIAELPNGARFSVERVDWGAGHTVSHYEVHSSGGQRRIDKIRSDGRHERGKAANTRSQIRDLLQMRIVQSVTIHNNGKTYDRPMSKRASRELLRSLLRGEKAMREREARRAARKAKQS